MLKKHGFMPEVCGYAQEDGFMSEECRYAQVAWLYTKGTGICLRSTIIYWRNLVISTDLPSQLDPKCLYVFIPNLLRMSAQSIICYTVANKTNN